MLLLVAAECVTIEEELPITEISQEYDNTKDLRTLEEIALSKELASVLWNYTEHYGLFNSSGVDTYCLQAINNNTELIGIYLINKTLSNASNFVSQRFLAAYKFSTGCEIAEADQIHKNYQNIINSQEEYLSTMTKVLNEIGFNSGELYNCAFDSRCGCIFTLEFENYLKEISIIRTHDKQIGQYLIFGKYIEPIMRILISAVGLALNITLIVIVFRKNSVRTEYNSVMINLFLNSILLIIIYSPISYLYKYHNMDSNFENSYFLVEILIISGSAFCIQMLNIQRYFDVSRALQPTDNYCRLSPLSRVTLYSSIIWAWSIVVSILTSLAQHKVIQFIRLTLNLFVYSLILPIVLLSFSIVTGMKLQRAAERERTTSELKYIISSSVLLSLTIVFYVVHIPFFIFTTIEIGKVGKNAFYYVSIYYRLFDLVLNAFFLAYPVFNTLALYNTSGVYRQYLKKYLWRCSNSYEDSVYIRMD